jgi:glutaredoxin
VSRAQAIAAGLVVAGAFFTLPAASSADRLVLRDGQMIETRGAVKLDSRRAIYTDLSGRLVALRIEEIDVARTTAPPTPPAQKDAALSPTPAPAVAPPKPPIFRLTDADVGHLEDAPAGMAAADAAPARVVTLYSTSWCGWCRKSRQLMQALGIAFVEKNVESDPRAAAEKDRLAPGAGVPVLVRGGEVVRGYNEETIRSWAPAVKAETQAQDRQQ